MNPIKLLQGYILSKLIHGSRITLLCATSMTLICHMAIAKNKPNKTPGADEGGGGTYSTAQTSTNVTLINCTNYLSNKYSKPAPSYLPELPGLNPNPAAQSLNTLPGDNKLESFSLKLQSYNILQNVQQKVNASDEDFKLFTNYYYDKLFANDRDAFWKLVETNQVKNDADIQAYAVKKIAEYVELYHNFLDVKKNYPGTLTEYSHRNHAPSAMALACNPACDNIDFETGDLSGWSAYYAANTSTTTAFSNSTPTGGVCGAVTKSALDPTTSTYQVTLTSGAGLDPVAGKLIPVVCPTGGTHSCRIGDSTRNGGQMGILQQTFTVTSSNCDFIYMYAVVLENPGHNYFQQPYFNVQMIDQNGNPIPNCGNYSVVSGPGLPGYTSVYYKPNGDTVYCKPWTTVFVPLKAYIGQCITIKVTTSDCALGGHFGYAYFDAVCSVSLITSSPAVCKGNATLTGPSGVSSYKWLGPCIIGSNTNQTVTVGCNGTYKVIISSVASAACSDTLSITLPLVPPPSLTVTGTNITCNGDNNGTATATVTGGASPYTYKWSPGGNTTSSISNLSAGTYTVAIYDTTGCGDTATVTITEPPVLTVTIASHHNSDCNGDNHGAAVASANGGTPSYNYHWSNGQNGKSSTSLTAGVYTVTVTDANGCTATASVTITQPPPLTVTATVTNVSCFGANNGQATASAAGGNGAYTYAWSTKPKQTNSAATGLSAGTYTITVTDSAGCSGVDSSVVITQPSALVVTISSSSNVSCNGGNNGSAVANGTGGVAPYNYLWSNGSTKTTASNLSAGTYTITVTDDNSCSGTASVTITQPATALSATISSSSNITCNGGNNGSATISGAGGTAPYNYLWSNSSVATTISNLSPGTYSVTITDANGCTASASVSITQPIVLVASVSSGIEVSCNGGNDGAATALGTGGTTPYNYLWSNSSSSATASNLTAGTYSVTITDANGCTSTSSVTITEPAKLTSAISASANITCNGANNGSAAVTAGGGTSPYKYLWSNGNTSTGINSLSAGSYNVTVTDVKGCSATTSVTITEPTPLTISFTSTAPLCNGLDNGSASALVSGGTAPYNYSWSTVPVQTNLSANKLSAGTYTVTITDANGCTANAAVTLTQPNVLLATISGSTNVVCYGGSNGSATSSVSGGTSPYNYSWTTSPMQTTPTATGLSAGTYTVATSDAHGCTSTASVTITAPARIHTTVTGPDTVCAGSNVTLNSSASGGNGTYFYHWSNGGGPSSNITVSPGNTTTYTVTTTDGNGCKGDTASITVNTLMLTSAAVGICPAQTSCAGDTVSIYATVNTTNSGSVTILWSNGNTTVGPFKVAPTTTTTYTIKVSDKCGNTVSKSVTITVNPLPAISIPPQAGAACTQVTLNFSDSNKANAGDSYYWTFGDKTSSNQSSPSHTYDQSGRYVVTVLVTSSKGCSNSAQAFMNIDIYPTAKASFSMNPNRATVVNPTISFTDNSVYTTQWFWNFGDGNTSRVQNPTHTYAPVVTGYKVDLITNNSWGCKDSVSDSVYIIPDFRIFIPNAFSPNADGLNEYFTAKGIGIEKFNMMIFDRWGNLLYTTDDINRGWNGTVMGGRKVAEEDTYVYKIEVTDIFKDQHSYIGAVTLIK